jgi:hypothetical protein
MQDVKADSPQGMKILMDWARSGSFVLEEAHEKCAQKHGVSTDGVKFSRRLPTADIRRKVA